MKTHLESFFSSFFDKLKARLSGFFACDQWFRTLFSILFSRPQIGFFVSEVFVFPVNFLVELNWLQESSNFIEQEEIIDEIDGQKYEHGDGESEIEAADQNNYQSDVGNEDWEDPTKVSPPSIFFP